MFNVIIHKYLLRFFSKILFFIQGERKIKEAFLHIKEKIMVINSAHIIFSFNKKVSIHFPVCAPTIFDNPILDLILNNPADNCNPMIYCS